ncbi:MAG: protealysin inhibitor emfourin [Synechococcales bacterium]|nr:protealysin inhibitor emfourin [Synechococcales bacterium]
MKIRFRQTGGFAGLSQSAELDTSQLPPTEATQIEQLVDQASFWEMRPPQRQIFPDQEQYSVTIESEGRSRTLHMGRSKIPPALKPLIDRLARDATYDKR